MKEFLRNIEHILGHEQDDGVGEGLKQEGINSIRDANNGAIPLPAGSISTLHQTMIRLLGKNGSATITEKTRIRCIGALGIIHRKYGTKVPSNLGEISAWLFSIAVTSEEITPLVQRRVGFVLDGEKIVKG